MEILFYIRLLGSSVGFAIGVFVRKKQKFINGLIAHNGVYLVSLLKRF